MAKRPHSQQAASRNSSTVTSEYESPADNGNSGVLADYSPAKRRASRAGTRCVSTLSLAQLARKRANDRDAQRAIRQRTKEHVENLERRIEELTSVRRNDEALNEVRLRNRQLEEELRRLRESLTTSGGLVAHSAPWTMQGCYGPSTLNPIIAEIPGNISTQRPSPDICAVIAGTPQTDYQGLDRTRDDSPFSAYGAEQFGVDSELSSEPSWVSPTQSLPDSFPTSQPSSYEMLSVWDENSSHNTCSSFTLQPRICGWELPIKFLPPVEPVEEILVGIIQKGRGSIIDGVNSHRWANARKLIFCDDQLNPAEDPISILVSDIINRLPVKRLPERAASLYIVHKLLRWQVSPSLDTYEDIPIWYTPRPSQLVQPHPIWVSLIIFPALREKIINNQQNYCAEEFRELFMLSVNVNWPFRDSDILAWQNGKLQMTPTFVNHVCQLENWTFGRPFSQRYPELAHLCRFTDVESNWP